MKINFFLILAVAFLSVSCGFSTFEKKDDKNLRQSWSYNLYANASRALWKSAAGSLDFSRPKNDPAGYVGKIDYGYLNPGVRAVSMLETRPQMISRGWIEGLYPEILLPEHVYLHTYIGFKKSADASDGATFHVFVYDGSTYKQVVIQKLFPRQYRNIDCDLSSWAGEKIQLILKVTAGDSSKADLAVWVNPRLENVEEKPSAAGQ